MSNRNHGRRPGSGLKHFLQSASAAVIGVASIIGGCGIEVGNPHGGKTGTGTATAGAFSLSLADAPIDDVKHVFLNIVSFGVVNAKGSLVGVLLAHSGKIDALELQNGKSLSLADGQSLEAGDYSAIVINLDKTNPILVVEADGTERSAALSDQSTAIYVEQAFTVTKAEALDLTLHLDLRRSLQRIAGNAHGFDFNPLASVLPRGSESSITGTFANPKATLVCAYLHHRDDFIPGGPLPPPPPRQDGGPHLTESAAEATMQKAIGADAPGPHPDDAGQRAPNPSLNRQSDRESGGPSVAIGGNNAPPPGAHARRPPSFASGDEMKKDEDSGCANAFAAAAVDGGAYTLAHLWPGRYELRFFLNDGTYIDAGADQDVDVEAGQAASFPEK